MMIPMSAFEPPWCVIKRGKRKKLLKLDMVNRFAIPIMINEGPYRVEAVLELNLESDLSTLLSKYFFKALYLSKSPVIVKELTGQVVRFYMGREKPPFRKV
ncbi:MAG: hypothetical protein WC649_12090 [Desulfobacteria bacterium]